MRILFIEDDPNLGRATQEGLRENFAVDWVKSAEQAETALITTHYELLVLDINLPGISGLEFLKKRRKINDKIPILLLTARDAINYRVEGLNSGADDYLVKPFDLDELLARCHALLRRSFGIVNQTISIKNITYETSTGYLTKDNQVIYLSSKERAIFDCLVRNLGKVISKEKIIESIYDWDSEGIESNTIEVHIAALRKKIGKQIITTIRSLGYSIHP